MLWRDEFFLQASVLMNKWEAMVDTAKLGNKVETEPYERNCKWTKTGCGNGTWGVTIVS